MIEQPDLRPVADGIWQLFGEWQYEWEIESVKNRLLVFAGFRCDLASVPRIAWTLTGLIPDGLHRAATLTHDWIYSHGGRLPPASQEWSDSSGQWTPTLGSWTREQADALFARMLRECGVGPIKRKLMYWAVRLFGWWSWRS